MNFKLKYEFVDEFEFWNSDESCVDINLSNASFISLITSLRGVVKITGRCQVVVLGVLHMKHLH